MSDEEAMRWWKRLPASERRYRIAALWKQEGEPQPEEEIKRTKRKPKLNLKDVEELCYRSKRAMQTERDFVRFRELYAEYTELPEFQDAMLRGQARAISEMPLQGTFDEIYSRLKSNYEKESA